MGDKCTKKFDDFGDGVLILGCRSGMLLFTTQDLCWQGPSKLPLNQHKQWGPQRFLHQSCPRQHPADPLEQIRSCLDVKIEGMTADRPGNSMRKDEKSTAFNLVEQLQTETLRQAQRLTLNDLT